MVVWTLLSVIFYSSQHGDCGDFKQNDLQFNSTDYFNPKSACAQIYRDYQMGPTPVNCLSIQKHPDKPFLLSSPKMANNFPNMAALAVTQTHRLAPRHVHEHAPSLPRIYLASSAMSGSWRNKECSDFVSYHEAHKCYHDAHLAQLCLKTCFMRYPHLHHPVGFQFMPLPSPSPGAVKNQTSLLKMDAIHSNSWKTRRRSWPRSSIQTVRPKYNHPHLPRTDTHASCLHEEPHDPPSNL